MRVDAELAFVELTHRDEADLRQVLPAGFSIEDRGDKGWGLAVRNTDDEMPDLQSALSALLAPLYPIAEKIAGHETILRIGVYHDTVTCTLLFKPDSKFLSFDTQLEITTYPSETVD